MIQKSIFNFKGMINRIKVSPKAKIIMAIRSVLLLSFLVLAFIIQNDISRYLIEENVDKAKKSAQQLLLSRETIADEYDNTRIMNELKHNNYNFFADYIVSNIAANMSKEYDISIKYLSDNNRNHKNKVHQDERHIYEKLRTKNIREYYEVDEKSNMIKYAVRVNTERRCLQCHGKKDIDVDPFVYKKFVERYHGEKAFGYKEGDMIGMVLVNVPMSLAKETTSQLGNTLLKSGAIIGILFAMLLIYLINRYFDNDIIAPLDRIANVLENYENDFTKTLPINKKNKELHTIATSFNLLVNRIKGFLYFFKDKTYSISNTTKEMQVVLNVLNSNLKKQLSLKSRLEQQLKTNEKLISHIKHNREAMSFSVDEIEMIKQEYTSGTFRSNLMLDKYIAQQSKMMEIADVLKHILEDIKHGYFVDTKKIFELEKELHDSFSVEDIKVVERAIDENMANMMAMYEKSNILIRHNQSKDSMIDSLLLEDEEVLEIFEELNTNTQNSFKNFKDISKLTYRSKDYLEEIALEIEHFRLK